MNIPEQIISATLNYLLTCPMGQVENLVNAYRQVLSQQNNQTTTDPAVEVVPKVDEPQS